MKKNKTWKKMSLLFILFIGMNSNSLFSQNYVTIGGGTNNTTSSIATPYSTYYHDARHQYLYTGQQLINNGAVAGMIWSLGFNVGSASGVPLNGFTIKLSTVPNTTTTIPVGWAANPTIVYSSSTPITPTMGWNQYSFQSPFYWNGSDGIIVEVCFDNTSWGTSTGVRYSNAANKSRGKYKDNDVGCSLGNGSLTNKRPNIRIDNTPIFTNDASVQSLINPTFPSCIVDSLVKIVLHNAGTANLNSVDINWSINGTLQTAFQWNGSIAQFDNDTVTLGTVIGGFSDNDVLKIWTSNPNGVLDSMNINDTISEILHSSLSGIYSIHPTPGTGYYHNFTEAIEAMQTYGVCGPVIFDVYDTNYTEQIEVSGIHGISDTNTVTFRTQPNNSQKAVIKYNPSNSGNNYVVKLKNISNIIFDNIAIKALGAPYSRALVTAGASNKSITVKNCLLTSTTTTYTTTNNAVVYMNTGDNSHWEFTNNTIMRGSYGILFKAPGGNLADSNVFTQNRFRHQRSYGAVITNQKDIQFERNNIFSNTAYPSGIAFSFEANFGGSYKSNYIEGRTHFPKEGMKFDGIGGTLNNMTQVSNNRIYMPANASTNALSIIDNLFVAYTFNSIYKSGTNSTNRGININGPGYVSLKNNNVQVRNAGIAIRIAGSSVAECDFNNLSVPDSTGRVGWINGTAHDSINHWQTASGFDANSLSIDSVYTDTTKLLVCTIDLYAKGTPIAGITTDFSGQARQTTPCIGADEFMALSVLGQNLNHTLCTGDTLTLTQLYFDTVIWNNVDTNKTHVFTTHGTQQISVIGLCGTGSANFDIIAQETVVINDTNLCEGTSAQLTANINNGSYLWSTGSTSSSITVDSAQTVSISVIDSNGCHSTDTIQITQSTDVSLVDSTTFCEGANVVIDANITGTYAWHDGSTNQTLSVNTPGMVSVTVTDQNCISSDSVFVSEILNPIASFTDSSSSYTVAFTNTSQNATSYLWEFGDGTTSTDVHPVHIYPWTNLDSVTVSVKLTAYNSCTDDFMVDTHVRYGKLISISEIDPLTGISVYPNPNHGRFNVSIESSQNSTMEIQVIQIDGSILHDDTFQSTRGEMIREVSLKDVAPGIYFVKVKNGQKVATYKILVQ